MPRLIYALTVLLVLGAAGPAHAYIGPGLGAGVIGAILGILGAVGLAIVAVVYYPIKRMLKKKRAGAAGGTKTEGQ